MRKLATAAVICLGCSVGFILPAHGQGRGGGNWSTAGGDPQLTGWQKTEPRLTRDVVKDIKLNWKIKLGTEPVTQPTEPLFGGHTITNAGFKDMVVVFGPGNTLTNVDYELGAILWQRHMASGAAKPAEGCSNGQFSAAVIQPAATFGGGGGRGAAGRGAGAAAGAGARGGAAAGTPGAAAGLVAGQPPANPPAVTPRVGGNLAGGVGFGGLRGIFVITADGTLHERELTNGWDYGAPIEVLPAGSNIAAPTIDGSSLYVTTGGCGSTSGGAYSVNMSTEADQKQSYDTGSVAVTGTDGPAFSNDNQTLFVTTGSGSGSGEVHPNSVVALDAKTMKAKDYFMTSGSGAAEKADLNVSPVVFTYKGRELVAAYVAGGKLALLDAASLGGSDHRTPLAITGPISNDGGKGSWGRLASAEDSNGVRFIYVSVRGGLAADVKLPASNGPITDGAVVAFKVSDVSGSVGLTPAWVSPNVENPSPASIVMNTAPQANAGFGGAAAAAATPPTVIAGGIVFTLSQGDVGRTHATLYGFDADTGKQIYTSGDAIASTANDASISISGGHVVFVTADNTLYCFGIAYERD